MLKHPLLLLALIISVNLWAQKPRVKHNTIAKGANTFSFVHITDTHIGEGCEAHDYGTKGYYDTICGKEGGYPAERLSSAVHWINENAAKEDIRFVLVSGDLTGAAEKSQFMHFKQIMDSLRVPYVPLIGNHDAWPYNHYEDEASHASGDSIMNEVFASTFDGLKKLDGWNDGSRTTRWHNPESGRDAYLHNYTYYYNNTLFVFLDFNPRYHVRKAEPGIGPEARLTDTIGGTLPFLRNALSTAKPTDNIVLISHHPPMKNFLGAHYSFSAKQRKQLRATISPYSNQVKAWFCGHMHRWWRYNSVGTKVYETKANKGQKHGGFRVVQVGY